MEKKHLYCFPGLGASTKIFERLQLPEDEIEMHLISWKIPTSFEESIHDYAARICEEIKHENPIILGVSFGGMIVQEMSKIIEVEKVIIVSSLKSHDEFPNRLKVIKDTKAYKLFPTGFIQNFEEYAKYFYGDFLKKKAELYKMYLSVRDPLYLKWALHNVLHWKQDTPLANLIHIHGTDDSIFPHKHIQDFIPVEGGKHEMILTKPRQISEILRKSIL